MAREKTTIKAEDYLFFYDAIVTKIQEYYKRIGRVVRYDSVWTQLDDQKKPYFLLFICAELRIDIKAADITLAFCDPNGGFANLNYMYALKNDIKNGANSVKVLKGRSDLYAKFIGYRDIIDFVENRSDDLTEEEQAVAVVESFYDYIALKQFHHAWELLSDDFQERIWSKYDQKEGTQEENNNRRLEYFKRGYFFFRELLNKHIFLAKKINDYKVDCMVYYEAELELPLIQEISLIGNLTIKQVDLFVENVNLLSEVITKHGGSEFDKRQIARLFHPAPIEFIWFICDIDPEVLKISYDVKTTDPPVSMLFKCTCIKKYNKWVIDRLLPRHC